MTEYEIPSGDELDGVFAEADARYRRIRVGAYRARMAGATHGELEVQFREQGRELLRQLYQDTLDLGAMCERRRVPAPAGADGVVRTRLEKDHRRALTTVFGPVTVTRMAYRAPGAPNLHPADRELNLPGGLYSHELARLVAREAARGSFDETVAAVERATGVAVGKRQVVELARGAAVDVAAFYDRPRPEVAPAGRVLVLQFDGKGVVMRPEALRPGTAKAAAVASQRLATRLSPGEKNGRKRMAEIAVVTDVTPVARTVEDILPHAHRPADQARKAPRTSGKWLAASLVADIPAVVTAGFAEAERRDPRHQRTRVVLVDGNNSQLEAIQAEAARRGVTTHILVDFVHVIEYIWKAAWSFFETGDPDVEEWVAEQGRLVLAGHAREVAAGIRERADYNGYNTTERKGADTAARYLDAKADWLDYPTFLANGWPIATGIVEGAVRHLVCDRMDITGARWGLEGAEAILQLRAVVTNGDFDAYWDYHLEQEHHRNHHRKFAHGNPPT